MNDKSGPTTTAAPRKKTKAPAFFNLVELLRWRAIHQPGRQAYTFLKDGEKEEACLTYEELDHGARSVGRRLQSSGAAGERALLFYPPGLDFVVAYFGCLYAGAVPIPVYPPGPGRSRNRLLAIARDAQPKFALTLPKFVPATEELLLVVRKELAGAPGCSVLDGTLDGALACEAAADWQPPEVGAETLALLQYTSGSTSTPKGVMVSHENLLHNCRIQALMCQYSEDTVQVGWLPHFHDFGIIGMIVESTVVGYPLILMSPAAFLRRPGRWLAAITRYRGTASGAPNFAFDLCVEKVTAEEKETLDLSSLKVLGNGAEPVRPETLERFSQAFASCGFRPEAFRPAYGLAESTLMVSTDHVGRLPAVKSFVASSLEARVVIEAQPGEEGTRRLTGCGPAAYPGQKALIVDPVTREALPDGRIGEIWASGRHVAHGYWNRPEETRETFGAMLEPTGEGPFLRTGDLGFFLDGELYVTGRLKDLIILHGRNIYPQDVEHAVERSVPAVRPGFGAAFGVEVEGEEKLVVAFEVRKPDTVDLDSVAGRIRQCLSEELEVHVHTVVLLVPGSIHKTSSGKIQRRACRTAFLSSNLKALLCDVQPTASWEDEPGAGEDLDRDELAALAAPERRQRLTLYLRRRLAGLLGKSVEEVGDDRPFTSFGLDSVRSIELADRLERDLGVALEPVKLLEAPTPGELAGVLAEELTAPVAVAEAVPAATGEDRHQPFPLTDIQHAYWVGRNPAVTLGGVGCHYYFELEGRRLDLEALGAAWRRVVERHEMLRAVVLPSGEQQILPEVPEYEIEVLDLRQEETSEAAAQLERGRRQMSHQVFATDRWPLFEVRATLLPEEVTRLHFGFDLLVADAWSLRLVLRELTLLYHQPEAALRPPSASFRDFVVREAAAGDSRQVRESEEYWSGRLAGLPPAPELPLASSPEALGRPRFVRRSERLSPETWARLKERAGDVGLTPSAFLLAAFGEVLGRWSKEPAFTLNVTLFNRPPRQELREVVGDFTSSTLLAVEPLPEETFEERAVRLQRQLWTQLKHRHMSGVRVLRELARRGGGAAWMPVVFTSLLYQDADPDGSGEAAPLGELVYDVSQTPQVWMDHQVSEDEAGLRLSWDTVDELFPEGLLDDMFGAHREFLEHLAAPGSILWQERRPRLLPAWQLERRAAVNATGADIAPALLHAAFLERARDEGSRTAVVSPEKSLTYDELYRRANQLGRALRRMGARPDTLVAVVLEKGWEQVVAVLGILQAGAAYLPIDPALPAQRRAYLLGHAETALAVTVTALDQRLEWPIDVRRVCVDDPALAGEDDGDLPQAARPEDLAYVIFTSGSTGQPKGVAIDHRAAWNTVADVNQRFAVGPGDRVLALSALNFDLSVYDLFGLLAVGGTVVLPDAGRRLEPCHWAQLVRQHAVTVWNTVPALMRLLVDYVEEQEEPFLASLRLVMMSGDWIPVSLPDRITRLAPETRVISLGGATEASIWSNYYPVERVDPTWVSIPYGVPLANQRFHVLDELLEPRPVWVPGQLMIAGDGLARGYWGDEEKTRASFFEHPRTGERLYRTGDLGRYLPDGNLEFLGREDAQVKIQGYRIELGEVEAALAQHRAVSAAVVTAIGARDGHRSLVAYTVAAGRGNGAGDETALSRVDWEAVLLAGRRQAREERPRPGAVLAVLERIGTACIRNNLLDLGLFREAGEACSLDELPSRCGVLPRHRKLVKQWLRLMAEDGVLAPRGEDTWVSTRPLSREDLTPLWDEARDDRLYGESFWSWIRLCTENQLGLLRGEVDPLDLFFPQGSWDVAEGIYQHNPLSEYFNAVAREVLRAAAASSSPERPLRVLEVGAGVGGTTAALLPVLPADATEYFFTDVTGFFTERAREKLGAYPFVRHHVLDVDREARRQLPEAHNLDVVVAANVLHDARQLRESLERLRSLLRPGGLLVLRELTRNHRFHTISVGFTPGYCNFEDERVADNVPLLSAARWREVLERSGFEGFAAFPDSEGPDDALQEHVMVARVPRAGTAAALEPSELRSFLKSKLPEYMVPSTFVELEALPLTAQGKVNRKALPEPGPVEETPAAGYEAPGNRTEAKIAEIWQEVLGRDRVGIHTNFFDLGGDSLYLTAVARLLRERFDCDVTTTELFRCPTVNDQARFLSQQKEEPAVPPDATRLAARSASMSRRAARRQQLHAEPAP